MNSAAAYVASAAGLLSFQALVWRRRQTSCTNRRLARCCCRIRLRKSRSLGGVNSISSSSSSSRLGNENVSLSLTKKFQKRRLVLGVWRWSTFAISASSKAATPCVAYLYTFLAKPSGRKCSRPQFSQLPACACKVARLAACLRWRLALTIGLVLADRNIPPDEAVASTMGGAQRHQSEMSDRVVR